ncbi:hypothetical protein TSAR_006861 [Trichomalopsis sarcophagae]|uniref:Secreted protein n=1 Tax=Trichomalopsis sarcophagae TaxID=543379 RepID=A0A232ELY4_9HYME|nr:hypothetical protein TSAR_006861 [Trichomalopsis sarcophagae]
MVFNGHVLTCFILALRSLITLLVKGSLSPDVAVTVYSFLVPAWYSFQASQYFSCARSNNFCALFECSKALSSTLGSRNTSKSTVAKFIHKLIANKFTM